MNVSCPPTCERPSQIAPGRLTRPSGLALAVPVLAVLAVAAVLEPRTGGFGTHQQLGIPPCSMLVETGWPCPTCGMTTSMAYAVRGHMILSMHAHPFGPVLAILMAGAGLAGLAQALSGRKLLVHLSRVGWWWGVVLGGGLLAGWGAKILVGYLGGQYPLH